MAKITNRFVHFKTKASFTSRLGAGDIQESSVVFIQDANEIWTHGTYYKCDISEAEVIALINSKGYITEADIPSLTGGASVTPGQYVSGVTVSGHNVTVTKAALPTSISGNAGTATKLATARNIAIAGAVSGNANFDGSANISISTTLANIDASKITSGTLNADRLPEIPISKIPAAAIERLYIVESKSAAMMLTIQEGDVVQIGSGGPMYFCVSMYAATFETKFKVFTAGAATSVPWSGVTGAPTKLSQFTNDSGFATTTQLENYLPLKGGTLTGKLTIPETYGALSTPLGNLLCKSSSADDWVYISIGEKTSIANEVNIYAENLNISRTSGKEIVASREWVKLQNYLTSVPAQTWANITGKPTFATVATSGSYNDLTNKPTSFTWKNGTTSGPTGSLTGSGMNAVSFGAIPSASATQSGVVTTGDQTFSGIKTIDTINVTNINEATPGEGFWIGYNTEGVIRIGRDGDYDFGTSGGTYSGTANTAKRLLNSLQFSNGQSFNGSSAVTIDLPEIPIALPNPYALTINGTSYTGSSAVSVNVPTPLIVDSLTSSTIYAGYSYNSTSSRSISTLSGFSTNKPDAVVISTGKLNWTNTTFNGNKGNVIKMDGLADLSGTYYIYCLSYMANGKIAVNGAVYA